MRLNKMTGRVIATMGIAAMMMTQTAGVMATEQTENKQLKVVYYNQADYPGKKIGGSTIQAAGCGPTPRPPGQESRGSRRERRGR